MDYEKLANIYLDYVNNFLSVQAFAAYYHLPIEAAHNLIKAGEQAHDFRVALIA